jgi:hypothetical protein
MAKIILQILAEDIRVTSYTDGTDCAITRALKRIGVSSDIIECGGYIGVPWGERITTPEELTEKVLGMYHYPQSRRCDDVTPLVPEDFSFELELPDHFLIKPTT